MSKPKQGYSCLRPEEIDSRCRGCDWAYYYDHYKTWGTCKCRTYETAPCDPYERVGLKRARKINPRKKDEDEDD